MGDLLAAAPIQLQPRLPGFPGCTATRRCSTRASRPRPASSPPRAGGTGRRRSKPGPARRRRAAD